MKLYNPKKGRLEGQMIFPMIFLSSNPAKMCTPSPLHTLKLRSEQKKQIRYVKRDHFTTKIVVFQFQANFQKPEAMSFRGGVNSTKKTLHLPTFGSSKMTPGPKTSHFGGRKSGNPLQNDHSLMYPVIWKILGLFSSPISREIDHP